MREIDVLLPLAKADKRMSKTYILLKKKPYVAGRKPRSDKDNELPALSPVDDKKSSTTCQPQVSKQLFCAAQVGKGQRLWPNGSFLRSRTTPVVHLLVCSTIFCRDFESAGASSPSALALPQPRGGAAHSARFGPWLPARGPPGQH